MERGLTVKDLRSILAKLPGSTLVYLRDPEAFEQWKPAASAYQRRICGAHQADRENPPLGLFIDLTE